MNKPMTPAEQQPAATAAPAAAAPTPVAKPAGKNSLPALPKAVAFLAFVLAPAALATFYLMVVAAPQYHSRVAFSVRSLDASPAASILGMLTAGSGGGAEDAMILHDYLRSQSFVEAIDRDAPFEEIFASDKADYLFRMPHDASIETKTFYWNLASSIAFDNTSRVIDVEVYAFSPEDAQRLAGLVAVESEKLVNRLSEAARKDAVGYAEQDVKDAEARLRGVRLKLSQFRSSSQEVDPTANAQLQYQLVASLEASYANASAQLETLRSYLGEGAPPITALKRRMKSLEDQIALERDKLAGGAEGGPDGEKSISSTLSVFEELSVEREFAERLYTAALAALSQAQTEARRSQRYLAVHISPTFADEALYPSRVMLSASVFFGLIMLWGIGDLIKTSITARS